MNESSIFFFPGGGHDHDGINSSLIDTFAYSMFDFSFEIFSTNPLRAVQQEYNLIGFKQLVIDTVNKSIIEPSGLILQPGIVNGNAHIIAGTITGTEIAANTIAANNILAGTITADQLSANIVLVNQVIASNNYVPGVSGWAINGNGVAEFDSASIRGAISAAAVVIDANNAWDNTGFILGGNTGIYTSNGIVRIGTSVVIEGAIVADEIVIDANNAWDNTGFILGGNTGIYTSSGVVHIGTSVVIEGTIVADSVDTPGVTIYSNGLLVTANLAIHPDGSISTASQKFYVNANGVLFANDAVITGSIEAGSLAINNNNFWNANGTMKVGSNSQYLVFDGSNVAVTGTVYADSGEIGGWSISGGRLVGPFSILDPDGNLYSGDNIEAGDKLVAYSAGEDALNLVNGGATIADNINVKGSGILYTGANVIGSPNIIAFRWDSPYLYGVVDGGGAVMIVGTASDSRAKTNVVDINTSCINKILSSVRVIEYNPIDYFNNNTISNKKLCGVIAQELKEVFPDLVYENINNPDALLSVNYAGFTPYLIKTVQHLNERIKALEQQLGYNS
ncbi:tail fiber domain-containing protein [bacterium]|nr:tail fiber domain-containing protein [bacterium]